MKKDFKIASILFIGITLLCLASTFIRWDETPLEQSLIALPVVIGTLLQLPFMGTWIGDIANLIDAEWVQTLFYQITWFILPFFVGAFYAALYYFIMKGTRKILKKLLPSRLA